MSTTTRAAVVGSGAWGTALASLLSGQGVTTTLWAREPEVVESVNSSRMNTVFLDGIELPEDLRATGDIDEAVAGAQVIVSAVPTQFIRAIWATVRDLPEGAIIVTVSKGIEAETLQTPHEIIEATSVLAGDRIVALSGPSFAREVATRLPTAVVVAGHGEAETKEVQQLFSTEWFRAYRTDDVVGVEIGGAMKNVMALAAGVADGLDFGHNTRAAIISRGLAEITRLSVACGGHAETSMGLSGLGDLVLTCTGGQSRNHFVGEAIGRGRKLADIQAEMNTVAEGVPTAKSAVQLAEKVGVELPITTEVYRLLYENADPAAALSSLTSRALRHERDDRGSPTHRDPGSGLVETS